MIKSGQISTRWGVELDGGEADLEAWRAWLKPPFDPFVEEIKDASGDYLALRSSEFDGLANSSEVHKAAKELLRTLNVAISVNADADPVASRAIIEIVDGSQPRKHQFIEAEGFASRTRFGGIQLIVKDAQGKVIATPPTPSAAQRWMSAAHQEPEIGNALRYLEGKPGWVELYKAYEAIKNFSNGGIPKSEIGRFTQTANFSARHHPNNKFKPHKRPMELWEARALITRWLSAAINDRLTRCP